MGAPRERIDVEARDAEEARVVTLDALPRRPMAMSGEMSDEQLRVLCRLMRLPAFGDRGRLIWVLWRAQTAGLHAVLRSGEISLSASWLVPGKLAEQQ